MIKITDFEQLQEGKYYCCENIENEKNERVNTNGIYLIKKIDKETKEIFEVFIKQDTNFLVSSPEHLIINNFDWYKQYLFGEEDIWIYKQLEDIEVEELNKELVLYLL